MAVGPQMMDVLRQFGLERLAGWLSIHTIAGSSIDEMMLDLYDQPEFKARFPAIDYRENHGLSPLSPAEYVAYENQTAQMASAYGINISKEQTDKFLMNNISAQEVEERVSIASRAAFSVDPLLRQSLSERYGVSMGDLTEFWLDPKRKLPDLQRKFATSEIDVSAQRSGFDTRLQTDQLDYLYGRGLTGETAPDAFGALVENEQLFEAVDDTEEDIGVDEQLALITGDADLRKKVERRGERRFAMGQGGGEFATGREGVAGLGTAETT